MKLPLSLPLPLRIGLLVLSVLNSTVFVGVLLTSPLRGGPNVWLSTSLILSLPLLLTSCLVFKRGFIGVALIVVNSPVPALLACICVWATVLDLSHR